MHHFSETDLAKKVWTGAKVHICWEFQTVVKVDEETIVADKACWSDANSQWCARHVNQLHPAQTPALQKGCGTLI